MQNKLMSYCSIITVIAFLIEPSTQNALEIIESAAHSPPQFRNQLMTDLFMLKDSLNQLKADLEKLSSRLNSQTEVIRSLKIQLSLSDNAFDECEMEGYFYEIDSKLIKIKQKIQQVVNDNDDQHMDNIDTIMHNVRKLSFDCSMDGHDVFVAFHTNITSKLEKFDRQMERLNAMEQRLINSEQDEMKAAAANDALTKLLNEIHSKLNEQEVKLEKLESFLPLMVNATQSMAAFKEQQNEDCSKQKCISRKILELTNAQVDVKP